MEMNSTACTATPGATKGDGLEPAAGGRITGCLVALCLLVTVAAVTWKAWDMFGPSRQPMLEGWNDSGYYFWLPAVVIDHNLDFAHQLAISGTVTPAAREAGLAQPRTKTGLLPSRYPPGWALGSLPFFLAAYAVAPAGATGFEPVFLLTVWIGQILYAAGGLWIAALVIRRLVPGAPALVAVLAVWLASPLVYYQTARVSLSHSQVFVLAIAVFWLTLVIVGGDRRARVWLGLGFASALLVATRNITVVYLMFPAVLLIRQVRSWRAVGWFGLGAAGPAAAQMIAWKVLFGSWIAYSYGDEVFDFAHLHLEGVLFSPFHGFFYWQPLLLVGFCGLIWWTLRHRIGWPWLVSFGVVTVLNAAWPCWWFASSFGNRGFEVPVFFGMFGIAVLWQAGRSRPGWRRALVGTISLAVAWNLGLLGLFLTRRIPREAPVTFGQDFRALVAWVEGTPRPPKPPDATGSRGGESLSR